MASPGTTYTSEWSRKTGIAFHDVLQTLSVEGLLTLAHTCLELSAKKGPAQLARHARAKLQGGQVLWHQVFVIIIIEKNLVGRSEV